MPDYIQIQTYATCDKLTFEDVLGRYRPRDTQRDFNKQGEKQKVAFNEEKVKVWHTESKLR